MDSIDNLRRLARAFHKRATQELDIEAIVQTSSDLPTNKVRVYRTDIRQTVVVNGFKFEPLLVVWIREQPDKEFSIVGVNIAASTQVFGEGVAPRSVPPGAQETVSWSIPAQGFVPLRLEASQRGGLYVHIRSGWYDNAFYDGDALNPATGLPTLNDFSLSGYTAATSGFSQWVIIWFDSSDTTIGIAANDEAFGEAALLLETTIDLSVVPAGCYPLGAVGLDYGQITIDDTSRIVDARFHLARHDTGGQFIVDYTSIIPAGVTAVIPRGVRIATSGSLTLLGGLYVI